MVAVVFVIGYAWLDPGFPESWQVDVTKWFDDFGVWAVENRTTSPLFVYFLTPIADASEFLYDNLLTALERMTWFGVVIGAAALAGVVAGWRMALLAGLGVLSFGLLGVWEAALETMALLTISVSLALLIGIPLGIWAGRRPRVERVLRPILDAMQTIPAYSYLLPFVLLFGIGIPPAVLATLAFALPPAIRLTALGIRDVPTTSLEVGESFGTTERQSLRMVQVPLAKPSIMLGVNQTFMMALGIVVIAAFVGADGLGQSVLDGLKRFDVGVALNGGIAIVVMAIVLDRVTTAWSVRSRTPPAPVHARRARRSRGGGRSPRRSSSRCSRSGSAARCSASRSSRSGSRPRSSSDTANSVVDWSQTNLRRRHRHAQRLDVDLRARPVREGVPRRALVDHRGALRGDRVRASPDGGSRPACSCVSWPSACSGCGTSPWRRSRSCSSR